MKILKRISLQFKILSIFFVIIVTFALLNVASVFQIRSEAMTIFAVACAGIFPLIHAGRPNFQKTTEYLNDNGFKTIDPVCFFLFKHFKIKPKNRVLNIIISKVSIILQRLLNQRLLKITTKMMIFVFYLVKLHRENLLKMLSP